MDTYLFLEAALGRKVDRFPVWFMRQAGRYLPEYRAVRDSSNGFLHMCMTPDIAAEISIQPFRIVHTDAVIMFSDILTPLIGMGIDLAFSPGPKIGTPVRSSADVARLIQPDPAENTGYVGELLRILRRELAGKVPVIGFAGAPFTLAAYLCADEPAGKTNMLKRLLWGNPEMFHTLMDKLTVLTVNYLNYQIDEGAQAVQLFDTWAGELDCETYEHAVLPYIVRIFAALKKKGDVPQIYFVNNSSHLLSAMTRAGADVISIDWRTPLPSAFAAAKATNLGVQGNLDPFMFFADDAALTAKTGAILQTAQEAAVNNRFIFNLGHGINKETDPAKVSLVVKTVQDFRL